MNVPAKADIVDSVITKGDLSKLTSEEKVRFYNETCKSLGLNPLTQPFAYLTLSGRQILYVTRSGADQLRKINNVSLEIISRQVANNILTVHCRARLPDGRVDEDYGSVYYPETLQGEARANAELKAVTKSKRRATLSICGLGWLSEEEIDDIPVQHRRPPTPAPNAMRPNDPYREIGMDQPQYDPDTGELPPHAANTSAADEAAPPDGPLPDGAALPVRPVRPDSKPVERSALAFEQSEVKLTSTKQEPKDGGKSPDFGERAALSLEDMAREAAMRGEAVFKTFYKSRSAQERKVLNDMGDELRELMS